MAPGRAAPSLGAVSKHISSDNRFSAWADPPGGGCGRRLVWPLRGGSLALDKTPLVGWGRGGLAPDENCKEYGCTAPLEVF
jgi:hypothetical protein